VNYYNEIDPYCAAWLQNLIDAGHIPAGDIDTRSIEDVRPDEVAGYTQCHWFAGIAGWPLALRLAGWPNSRRVWTGSCPCQPFSAAGKGCGFDDPRHLWPIWNRLIRACKPVVVFGEQVANKNALPWVDGVASDVEELGYEFAAIDFPASSIGSPHIRQRMYWVASMQQVQREQAVDGVLCREARQGRAAVLLQGVRPCEAKDLRRDTEGAKGQDTQDGSRIFTGVPSQESREGTCSPCTEAGREGQLGVRPGQTHCGVANEDRQRFLRADWFAYAGHEREALEYAVNRPNHSESRVRADECQGSLFGSELRAGVLGSGCPVTDCRCASGECVNEPSIENSGLARGETQFGSVDSLHAQDEDAGDAAMEVDTINQGIGAPHIRDRNYWMADSNGERGTTGLPAQTRRHEGIARITDDSGSEHAGTSRRSAPGGMADSEQCSDRREAASTDHIGSQTYRSADQRGGHSGSLVQRPGPTNGQWADADWLGCTDGKWRPVEPKSSALAPRLPRGVGSVCADPEFYAKRENQGSRVGRLKGYGNAIVPAQAAEFVAAFLEMETVA
jgi:site-specific DNA-cytosine methylase